MKKLFTIFLALIMVGTLTACGGEKSDFDPIEAFGSDVLNVYNWGEYIGEDVIRNFENKYNVRVNYSLFDSNEAMYTKLLSGTQYDILVPSDYMIERLIGEGLLQPIDYSLLTNVDSIDPQVLEMREAYDPGGVYSIPYFWGTVGIAYNKNNISLDELEAEGWNILKNPAHKGSVYMYDSERDSFMVALKALGYSMNTENMDEINKANEWLIELHNTMDPAYVCDEVHDNMINELKDLAVVYSGAAAYIISENPNIGFYMPKEGTNLWSDDIVIPANAASPKLAHAFIDFVLEYDSQVDNSMTVGYTSVNAQVTKDLSAPGEFFDGNEAYVLDSSNPKNEVFKHNETLKKVLSDLWIKVKVR